MDLTESFFKMASSLAVVLALMLLAAAAARRWLRPMLSGGASIPTIRLMTSLALGSRRSVLVLEVAGRTLVIGATPQQLVLLTQFDRPAPEAVVSTQFMDVGLVRPEPVKESQVPVYARVSEAIRNHQTRATARSKP
jgi:flagellar biosynthetic protein FliO